MLLGDVSCVIQGVRGEGIVLTRRTIHIKGEDGGRNGEEGSVIERIEIEREGVFLRECLER